LKTIFLLMAQYDARSIIPIDIVCRDYFPHLKTEALLAKISAGEIALPLIRMERSQKTAKGVHIHDLANYIDERRATAQKETEQLRGWR
jgi:hypothetical protein